MNERMRYLTMKGTHEGLRASVPPTQPHQRVATNRSKWESKLVLELRRVMSGTAAPCSYAMVVDEEWSTPLLRGAKGWGWGWRGGGRRA